MQDIEVLSKIGSSDHRMIRRKLSLSLKKENTKHMITKKPPMESVRPRSKCKITFQNTFVLLVEHNEVSEDRLSENLTPAIIELAAGLGEATRW